MGPDGGRAGKSLAPVSILGLALECANLQGQRGAIAQLVRAHP